ncbi:prohead protease [Bacillus phage Thurquoise]|uniref:Prohead protease n=1 Tax=Bacillus phage Deep Blue TaxID=1792245 RepID=A0A140HM16_9CAUD|nr:head maturation protease [Bacillus phage Deep Blue]AMO26028.1 prohead protease [Bacillus phage Deep Blue]UXQ88925.1 prohead protease [Bacillus phage Thurquoise]
MQAVNPITGKVNLFVPIDLDESISKSNEDPTSKSWCLKGYATTPDLDLQDDIIDPKGIDISHFITHGYLNYEHFQGEEYKVGVPTEGTHVDDVGLFVEGKLYKDNPYAKSIWNLANSIQKSGIDRKIGFSIEGYAKARDKADPRIIKSTYITNVAVTTNPANPHATWDAFMKSFMVGYAITPEESTGVAAISPDSLARSLYNLSWSLKKEDESEFKNVWGEVGNYLDAMERYTPETAILFLQISKGYSRAEAKEKLEQLSQMAKEDI